MRRWIQKRQAARRRRGERGYVLSASAIIMIPLLAISGMATDLGAWYAEGTKMQKAADAAALAGVVWLPDLTKATTVATQVAKENGFDNADSEITVTVGRTNDHELAVTIKDDSAMQFFSVFFVNDVSIERVSVAKYVLAIPLGSPKNYFGTGDMDIDGAREGFFAAINGRCATTAAGDAIASKTNADYCAGTNNSWFKEHPRWQYDYIIDVPYGRTTETVVYLYDPASSLGTPDNTYVAGLSTTEFSLRSPDGTPFDDSDNPYVTCTGAGDGAGASNTNPRQYPAVSRGSGDNDRTLFGRSGWSRFCTISAGAPGGEYMLGVRTLDGGTNARDWANSYSIFVSQGNTADTCDVRVTPICPSISAREHMSVYANNLKKANGDPVTQAEFFLASIDQEHSGKQVEIDLFDPGENGEYIQILDPNGDPVDMTWRVDGGAQQGPSDKLYVSDAGNNAAFNGKHVTIIADLPIDYVDQFGALTWWKIRYKYLGAVDDRATWSAQVIGDPVHLVH